MKLIKSEGIRQRSEGSFEIDFRVSGQRVQRTIKAFSIKEAKIERAKLIAEALNSPKSQVQDGLTFEAIWPILEDNIKSDGVSHKTVLHLKRVYDRVFTEYRNLKFPNISRLDQLTRLFMLRYKSYYGVELDRNKGLRAELGKLKMIISRLRNLRFISEELATELKIPTPPPNKKAFPEITDTKIKELFAYIKKDRPDAYGALYFMLRTGRRVEETTLIERKDIQWDGFNPCRVDIRAETTKMDTAAPLNFLDGDLQAHIRLYYQISKTHQPPYLFLNRQNQKFALNALTEYLGIVSQEVLKVKITCHYLRHRFCTETCKARLPLVDIQAISGIRNTDTLIRYYCHSSAEGQASVLEKTKL